MRRSRFAVGALAASAAVALLAGCGGSDAPASSGSAAATQAAGGPQTVLDRQRLTTLDQPLGFPQGKKRVPSVTSRIIALEPGQQTAPQLYKGPTYVYVLEGQYAVEYAAGVSKTYEAGTGYLEGVNTTLTGSNPSSGTTRVMIVQFGSAKP